ARGGAGADDEMRVRRVEGIGEGDRRGSEVADVLNDDRGGLADQDGAKGDARIRISDFADRAVAVVDDEEVSAAVDRDTDGVVDLRKGREAAVAGVACGPGAEGDCDV